VGEWAQQVVRGLVAIYSLCTKRLCRYAAGGWRRLKVRDAGDASVARAKEEISHAGAKDLLCVVRYGFFARAHQAAHPTDNDDQLGHRPPAPTCTDPACRLHRCRSAALR